MLIQPIVSFGPDSLRLDECLLAVSVNILQFGANKSRGSAGYRVAIWATLTELVSLNHSDASLDRKPNINHPQFHTNWWKSIPSDDKILNFDGGKTQKKAKKCTPLLVFFWFSFHITRPDSLHMEDPSTQKRLTTGAAICPCRSLFSPSLSKPLCDLIHSPFSPNPTLAVVCYRIVIVRGECSAIRRRVYAGPTRRRGEMF